MIYFKFKHLRRIIVVQRYEKFRNDSFLSFSAKSDKNAAYPANRARRTTQSELLNAILLTCTEGMT